MTDVRGHREGTIFPRTVRGQYVVFTAAVQMEDGTRPTKGCPHRHELGATRECRESRDELAKLLDRRDAGSGDPRRVKLGPYLERWVSSLSGLAPSTVRQHEMIVRVHLSRDRIGRMRLAALRHSHVNDYLSRKALEPKTSKKAKPSDEPKLRDPQTLRHHRATLRRALADAQRERLVAFNAAAESTPPRLPVRERQILAPAEVRRLVEGTRNTRWHALWTVGAMCGLRLSEALGLVWSDVEGDTLHVRAQLGRDASGWVRVQLKTAKSRRSIPLAAVVKRALDEHHAIQDEDRGDAPEPIDGYVFLTPTGHNIAGPNVLPHLYRDLARLELPRVTFHDLRHSAATTLYALGVPLPVVSDWLGHSTIRITADLYRHRVPELSRDAADRLDGLFGGGSAAQTAAQTAEADR